MYQPHVGEDAIDTGEMLVSSVRGCKPQTTVAQTRLRSSFIYLANAVNDLRGNWGALALILAPLVLVSSLCLLPDALNLQARVARAFTSFTSGVHNVENRVHSVGTRPVQEPYHPGGETRPPDLYPAWMTRVLHLVFALLTLVVDLVVLCALARIETGTRARDTLSETIEVYRRAVALLPAFFWIAILQALAMLVGLALLVVPAALAFVWVYFAQYSLVFDGKHSWHALLHSRDLMRGRFLKVAARIIVFLAVWSGYNSWTSGVFLIASLLMGPVAVYTGFVWVTVFALDVLGVAVVYVTTAFFYAAGARLYRDLVAIGQESAVAASEAAALQDTGPLSSFGV